MIVSKQKRRSWIYIHGEDEAALSRILKNYGDKISETDVCTVLISLALKAAAEVGYVLPVQLQASTEPRKEKTK